MSKSAGSLSVLGAAGILHLSVIVLVDVFSFSSPFLIMGHKLREVYEVMSTLRQSLCEIFQMSLRVWINGLSRTPDRCGGDGGRPLQDSEFPIPFFKVDLQQFIGHCTFNRDSSTCMPTLQRY